MMQKGNINVQTENIFPIIKKFLYSDHDIFLRELVSNAVDATKKVEVLAKKGEVQGDVSNLQIEVKIDKEAKTLTVSDNGIGMTAEEIDKYINQIAFSSAEEFLEKFKGTDDKAQIIGHFGLGFYSAFMVADRVDIITKSYKDEPASKWSCDGSPEYTIEETEKAERGTDIILHINEESTEFLETFKIRELLTKYCKFLPVPIKFGTEDYEVATGKKDKDGNEIMETKTKDSIINNTHPAWTKQPSELTDEDYLKFYRELYPMSEDPMFWIHLNVDFPFKLTGILYFPKLKKTYEVQKNKISLYSNQVFVTDNVENIVPEFLTLLHGVIDSPDIPLNVSRSYLQSDKNVKKITGHISKKVSDKLVELFKTDRKSYEEKWESLGVFVKYGMLSDEKFYERTKSACLLENTEAELFTIEEYIEKVKGLQTDKDGKTVLLYTSDKDGQDTYIRNAKNRGYDVLVMDVLIDNHFMQHLEMKEENISFKRVDADTVDKLIEKDENVESVLSKDEEEKLKKLYEETINNTDYTVELKALSPEDMPVQITQSEWLRRMKEMQQMGGGGMGFMGNMPGGYNLVVNTNHPLAQSVLKSKGKQNEKINQLFELALLSQGLLKGKKLTDFIQRSMKGME
ncbi:MAG: molecular chaperone HtpG [Bacteroidetes bacterium]|nr:molecular chaperone HtpG [Bacteroidota bacterium]MCB9226525.1 molecular chaperone HtpG [Chitinophagales bacterium]